MWKLPTLRFERPIMETFIRHYTNVIPPELCHDIIEHYEDFCANKQEVLVKNSLCHDTEGNKICGACDCQRLEMTRYDEFSDKVEPIVKYLRETVNRYVKDVGCVVNMWPEKYAYEAIRIKRYLNDGNFGVTGQCKEMNQEEIDLLENHSFEEIQNLFWRNSNLNFNNPLTLINSLDEKPNRNWLRKIHECTDEKALKYFLRDNKIK